MTLDGISIAKKSEPQHNLGKIASSVASYQMLPVYDRIVHGSTMVYISWLMYLYVWWYVQIFSSVMDPEMSVFNQFNPMFQSQDGQGISPSQWSTMNHEALSTTNVPWN